MCRRPRVIYCRKTSKRQRRATTPSTAANSNRDECEHERVREERHAHASALLHFYRFCLRRRTPSLSLCLSFSPRASWVAFFFYWAFSVCRDSPTGIFQFCQGFYVLICEKYCCSRLSYWTKGMCVSELFFHSTKAGVLYWRFWLFKWY